MSREVLYNPYGKVNWSIVKKFRGDFHQHSTESDGREHPAILIDQATQTDMDIFVITDHDSVSIERGMYPKIHGKYMNTFPYSVYDGDVFYDPNEQGNFSVLKREGTSGEFDIDSNGMMKGMLALQGVELSEQHHIISILSDVNGSPGGYTEEMALKMVDDAGGVSYFAHPGDYSDQELGRWFDPKYTARWYKEMLKKYPSCLGVEIVNQNDRYYNDRKLWDEINNLGYETQHVWGFSGTDSHWEFRTTNHNVIFMNELTKEELKRRLHEGAFYCVYGDNPPEIESVEVSESNKKIRVVIENESDRIEWVSGGQVIHVGETLDYNDTLGLTHNVRAVIYGKGGVAYTNPIYFGKFINNFNFL